MKNHDVPPLRNDNRRSIEEEMIHVLCVDDENCFLNSAKQILELQGSLSVETASSVNEALQKMTDKLFDVIVSDYMMPEKNGLDFLRELRENGNDIPFILFTGKGREEVAVKALNLGAYRYFNEVGHPETVYTELAHGIRQVAVQRRAEKALHDSEEKFRTLAEQSPNMIFINQEGRIVYVNRKCEELMGYTNEEFCSPGFNFFTLISQESREAVKSSFSKHMSSKEVPSYEYSLVTKEGKRMEAILTTKLITYKGKNAILGTVTDITERKKAEETLNETLTKLETLNEKLDVVGKLTRHDARNKLSVIANNIYLAKQQLADDHIALEYLNAIESAVGQMEKIFGFAIVYEMLGVEELSYVDVKKSVDEAIMLFSGSDDKTFVNECEDLTVLADSLLRQVFYNLIDNSLKHGEKVTQIRVHYKEGKDELKLVYDDDGVGIPEDDKEDIFKEGYGKGTGYGLYLIKKTCEAYGWTIQETGVHGKGAQFTITVPKITKNGKNSYIVT